ncbi:MAG: aldehyde dehydrogenase, partial [Hylemonella sp.]
MDRQPAAVLDAANPATYGLLIDGQWVMGAGPRVNVLDKFRLQPCASLTLADASQIRQAVDSAQAAFRAGAPVA